MPTPIDRNKPLRLKDAAKHFGPNSGLNERSLGRLARQGKLRTSRIAGKDFTTLAYIDEMMERSSARRSRRVPAPVEAGDAVARAEAAIEAITR